MRAGDGAAAMVLDFAGFVLFFFVFFFFFHGLGTFFSPLVGWTVPEQLGWVPPPKRSGDVTGSPAWKMLRMGFGACFGEPCLEVAKDRAWGTFWLPGLTPCSHGAARWQPGTPGPRCASVSPRAAEVLLALSLCTQWPLYVCSLIMLFG